ncbi:MAG: hypothetical protein H6619_03150 [Deltaproteobacteria bacterium]|nr:hypothetical protein [Deltaproteobacteria bacterium]
MTGPTIFMSCVLIVYLIGISYRDRPRIHWKIMVLGMCADIGLTLWLELSRGAIRQAAGVMEFEHSKELLFRVHIPIAVGLFLCYFFVSRSGYKLMKGRFDDPQKARQRHRAIGIMTLGCYVGSFLTAPGFLIEQFFYS